MGRRQEVLGRVVTANNARVRRSEGAQANPRDLGAVDWHRHVVAAFPDIRVEWDRFEAAGNRLPLIEDLIAEHQGNEGAWRAGLLVSRGRPCGPLVAHFPTTVAALAKVPGLRSALWSYLDAGTELPEHLGPNAGVLRYHLGVRCGDGAALQVGDVVVPYHDREGVLFDDTVPHAAWNRGERPRITLFCELDRPLPRRAALANRAVQWVISQDSRYRAAPARAFELHEALNQG